MKPVAVTVSRFRGWRSTCRISLEAPITTIVGDNGRGKSGLLNAIEWCLYGAVVTKKGSGIDERQDWELRTRTESPDTEPTRVELEFNTSEGLITVCRERRAGAKAREADTFRIEFPNGTDLIDEDTDYWLAEAGIPDWETYRRAHCFHQEAARQRIVLASERTAILAALLGLDDDIALRSTIEAHQPSKLFSEVDRRTSTLNEEANRALHLPQQRLSEIERLGVEHGIDSSNLSESSAQTLRSKLVARAQALESALGLSTSVPNVRDAAAIRKWAPMWPTTARSKAPALSVLESHRREAARLDGHIAKHEEDFGAWQESRSQLELERQTGAGSDRALREAEVTKAKATLSKSTSALQQNNATVKLLIDAKSAIAATGQNDECPVCETSVPMLASRLETTIDRLRSDEFQALQSAEEDARTTLENARLSLQQLQELIDEEGRTRQQVERQRHELRQMLPTDGSTLADDALVEAKKRRESLGSEITKLEGLVSERDQSIEEHQTDWSRLNVVEKWLVASERAESSIDLSALPEWSAFNEALDELAGFGADMAFLGGLARDVQAERSTARAAEVNGALAKYYSLITQEDTAIQVNVHTTATRISYDLVDASGRLAIPVLNQAAINALSLAVLFAQSEAQAGDDSWKLVTLDDPVQSLDVEKQTGLSRAIEELANSCSVLVATVPGLFSDRIQEYVSKQRHIVTLGRWSHVDGATIESELDR